jgi:hypothetical protein
MASLLKVISQVKIIGQKVFSPIFQTKTFSDIVGDTLITTNTRHSSRRVATMRGGSAGDFTQRIALAADYPSHLHRPDD